MKDRGKLVFISSNTSGTGRVFLEKALDMGFAPVLLCEDPARFPFVRCLPVAVECLDVTQEQLVLEHLRKMALCVCGRGAFLQ